VNKETRIASFVENYEAFAQREDSGDLKFPAEVTSFYTDLFADELPGGGGTEDTGATEGTEDTGKKKEPDPSKPPQPPAGKKPAPKPQVSKVKEMVGKLIGEGKWTRKQILDKVATKHPEKAVSTIRTYITDALSETYSERYFGEGKRAVMDDKNIMSWK